MEAYITDFIFKTPAMTVQVLDLNNNLKDVFDAPPGLRFAEYILSLHPTEMVTSYPSRANEPRIIKVSGVGTYIGTYKS